jgi:hypothetical protein
MRILFDHGTPSGIARSLASHEITEAIERGWERISNGELLTKAEAAGFELLITTDKNIRYQQNLKGRKIGIVVLGNSAWRMARQHVDRIIAAVNAATPGSYAEVEIPFKYPRLVGDGDEVAGLSRPDIDVTHGAELPTNHPIAALGGHALENSLFREFNEAHRLSARDGWEVFQEFLNRRSAFPVVDQGLDGDMRSAEARSAAHALRIDPNHFVERDFLFQSDAMSLTERLWRCGL